MAQGGSSSASIELAFTPTDRAQIAVWVERADGTFMGTLALTQATATYGIGNRPGALQMNSGYRWPYGRREGVLPVWAHRRASAPDASLFRRVIFQNRGSEGYASRTSSDYSVEEYFCLSFDRTTTSRDALDAVTCASVFNSDKGRFITRADIDAGYAEPYEGTTGSGVMRQLDLFSLYPPRRDVRRCAAAGCYDHEDVTEFPREALSVMPELDAVARATPQGSQEQRWVLGIPDAWPRDGEYVLYAEVNTEGDYNDTFNDTTYPTPTTPANRWDSWAVTYGYPYRGQPSAVYSVGFELNGSGEYAGGAIGRGALEGEHGEMGMLDASMTDAHGTATGSGIDRLHAPSGQPRLSLRVAQTNPCEGPNPPPACGLDCTQKADICGEALVCQNGQCTPLCVATPDPPAVSNLVVAPHGDRSRSHMWADLTFEVPESEMPIGEYLVWVTDGTRTWDAQTPDAVQEIMPVALNVCALDDEGNNPCLKDEPGQLRSVVVAGLKADTEYSISVIARDAMCNKLSEPASADLTTDTIQFTTVSPCFVATAAYGSPLAADIGILRRFRDRYMLSNAPGRALVSAYYEHGPKAAAWIRENPTMRKGVRTVLRGVVDLLRWLHD